jgi:hypothetical protein
MTESPAVDDHDHVVADLADRFEMVLEAVEGDAGWATNRADDRGDVEDQGVPRRAP